MALHVALTHETHYRYDRKIGMGPQVIRLRPAPHCRTPILSYSLTLEPKTHFVNWQQDPFGNFLARVVLPEQTGGFSVTVDLVADMAVINPFDFFVEESAKDWPFEYDAILKKELGPYLEAEAPGPLLKRYLAGIDRKRQVTIDFLCDLNRRLQTDVSYLVRLEPGVQTPEETLERDIRLVPRQRLAAGADAAALRIGGAVRFRLPDPAHAGREVARRPDRH